MSNELEDLSDIELGYQAGVRGVDARMVSGWFEGRPPEEIRVELCLLIRQHDALLVASGGEAKP